MKPIAAAPPLVHLEDHQVRSPAIDHRRIEADGNAGPRSPTAGRRGRAWVWQAGRQRASQQPGAVQSGNIRLFPDRQRHAATPFVMHDPARDQPGPVENLGLAAVVDRHAGHRQSGIGGEVLQSRGRCRSADRGQAEDCRPGNCGPKGALAAFFNQGRRAGNHQGRLLCFVLVLEIKASLRGRTTDGNLPRQAYPPYFRGTAGVSPPGLRLGVADFSAGGESSIIATSSNQAVPAMSRNSR